MAELSLTDFLEKSRELLNKNRELVGEGGQGGVRGHPELEGRFEEFLPKGEKGPAKRPGPVNFETLKQEVELLSPPDRLRYEKVDMLTKLFRDKWVTHPSDPHLIVDNEICATCPGEWCLYVCPSQRYSKDEQGLIHVDYEGCFECGTCRVACLPGGVYWKYPLGSFGVSYREG